VKIKVSDYIARFYADKGIDTAFVLTGGCIVHVIDSIGSTPGIKYIPTLHEQSAAMAADAYARTTGRPGLMAVTSGPGATNLLTGICCSYYDSIPVIAITGQVPSNSLKHDVPTRQLGFQETDVVSIYSSVTKYSALVEDVASIRYELEKSYHIATTGRMGPVLLDICENVLFAEVEEDDLVGYTHEDEFPCVTAEQVQMVLSYLSEAKRPVLVLGGGVRQSVPSSACLSIIERLNIPVLLTWGAFDLIDHNHPLFAGGFGVTSARSGNFVVQNSDLIIAIGTRFDTHEIGSKADTFARGAKRLVVDIDSGEFAKLESVGFRVDMPILSSAANFIESLGSAVIESAPDLVSWMHNIADWRARYPICTPDHENQPGYVNPYVFFNRLPAALPAASIVVTDCGSNLIWTMQGLPLSAGQRVISAFNHSPMGYSLPASIGAAFAEPDSTVMCIIGDGGFQINIQELAIIQKHNLNIKIFVMNNHCHGIIQGTQNAWLDGRHHASSPNDGGLPDPDVIKISLAYGIPAADVEDPEALPSLFADVFSEAGPRLINVHMKQETQIEPKLMFGRPIEDLHPLLPREELEANMLVPLCR